MESMEYPNLNNVDSQNRTERSEWKIKRIAFMRAVREALGQKLEQKKEKLHD